MLNTSLIVKRLTMTGVLEDEEGTLSRTSGIV